MVLMMVVTLVGWHVAGFWGMLVTSLARGSRGMRGGRRYRRSGGIDPWVVLWGLDAISRASRGGGGGLPRHKQRRARRAGLPPPPRPR